MLLLYRITENKRYLDFCLKIAADWERPDGHIPNLIANALSGRPLHAWYPRPQTWGKVYELLSCLDGLLELYRVTGTEKYLTAVSTLHDLLKQYEGNTLFSVGFNDIFANGAALINSCSEPCDVIHWMRVNYELFTLTGKAEYLDDFEKAFLNPFLAASFEDGKWGARAVRVLGRHMAVTGQSSMKYSHCCVNNMPRGYINACQAFVMTGNDGVYVNLYTPYQRQVLLVRPGITGLASIRFRNENDLLTASDDPNRTYVEQIMPRKIDLDLEYIPHASVFYDIKLIFQTFAVVIKE